MSNNQTESTESPICHPESPICHPESLICHPESLICHPESLICHPERSRRISFLRFLISAVIVAICLSSFAACSSDDNKNPSRPEKNNGKAQKNPYTVPTFSDEAFKAIPDPCTTVSIENIALLTPGAKESGSLQQNSIGPNKTCEWKIQEDSFPRLGVSIIQSSDFFKPKDSRPLDLPALGEKVFVAPEYVTALGGDSCGETIYVVSGKYSFNVAYCDANGKATSDEKLIELATSVKNSIPLN